MHSLSLSHSYEQTALSTNPTSLSYSCTHSAMLTYTHHHSQFFVSLSLFLLFSLTHIQALTLSHSLVVIFQCEAATARQAGTSCDGNLVCGSGTFFSFAKISRYFFSLREIFFSWNFEAFLKKIRRTENFKKWSPVSVFYLTELFSVFFHLLRNSFDQKNDEDDDDDKKKKKK